MGNKALRPQDHHLHAMARPIRLGDGLAQHFRLAIQTRMVPHTRTGKIDHLRDPRPVRRLEHVHRASDIQVPEGIDIFGPGGLMNPMPGRHMDHTVHPREPTRESVAIQDRSCHIDPAGIRGRHNVQPQGGIATCCQHGGQYAT